MKSKYIATIIFVLFFGISYSQTNREETAVANCVLNALKAGKDSLIIQCIPSRQEFNYIVETAKSSSDKTNPPVDTVIKSITTGAINNINRIFTKSQNKKVNWTDVKIDSISINNLKPQFDKIRKANIVVYLSQEEMKFSLTLTRCLFISDTWRIMDPIVWKD